MTKRALNLVGFKQLSQKMQLDLLYNDGVHVGKRNVDGDVVILFQLYGFYVEVYYTDYRKEVKQLISSESADILQPYLQQIPIRDLDKDIKSE